MVRSPCYDKNGRKKGAWSPEEDDKLRAYVQRFGHWNWRELPKFAGRKETSFFFLISFRKKFSRNQTLKGSVCQCNSNFGCSGLSRCGKSCRLRWLNYLQPNVKRGNYSEEEEEKIKKLHTELGNKYVKSQ